jgi:putative transposase
MERRSNLEIAYSLRNKDGRLRAVTQDQEIRTYHYKANDSKRFFRQSLGINTIAPAKKKEMIISYREQNPTIPVSQLQDAIVLSNNGLHYQHIQKHNEPELCTAIESIYLKSPYYGYPRITAQLKKQEVIVNHKKVYRIMGELYLLHLRKSSFKPKTTDSRHNYIVYANEIKYLGKVTEKGVVWVSDVTYVWIGQKWCYLALIMDQGTRKIVGWAMSTTLHKELCIEALQLALENNPPPLYHHSDRGSQYCSYEYTGILKAHNITISMADTGVSVDNPFAESLNRSIKVEEVYLNAYETFAEAKESISKYILVYNTTRLHSSLGYMSPYEYEAQLLVKMS